MTDNNDLQTNNSIEDDSDATQINFDTINLDSFTIKECTSTSDEWKKIVSFSLLSN